MGTPVPVSRWPSVSVVVPDRNEEASLRACLESLLAQVGIEFEIIVVDDGSTDGTRGIAQSFSDVRVITPGPLPPGWTGKNNAVAAGAREARGEWLLFTDADTVHQPGSLARAAAAGRRLDQKSDAAISASRTFGVAPAAGLRHSDRRIHRRPLCMAGRSRALCLCHSNDHIPVHAFSSKKDPPSTFSLERKCSRFPRPAALLLSAVAFETIL